MWLLFRVGCGMVGMSMVRVVEQDGIIIVIVMFVVRICASCFFVFWEISIKLDERDVFAL